MPGTLADANAWAMILLRAETETFKTTIWCRINYGVQIAVIMSTI